MLRPYRTLSPVVVLFLASCAPSESPSLDAPSCPVTQEAGCTASLLPLEGRGQEPAWQIEVSVDSIVLVQDLGTRRTSVPVDAQRTGALRTDLTGKTHDASIEVAILRALCRDTMSGMPHPYSLEVTLDQTTTLSGCAGDPSALLRPGSEWEVIRIGESEDTVEPRPTVQVDFLEGRVSGNASCNRYHAGIELTGEGLYLTSTLASTRMACAEPTGSQEERFLSLIQSLQGFDITREGLLLLTEDGALLLAPRDVTPPE
jgi:heat shock protein HslJ